MTRPTRRILLALATLLLSSCSCQEENGMPDSGATDAGATDTDSDADVDADADTDADGGTDSGAVPVDPEIVRVEVEAGSFTLGSPAGTPCMAPVTEKEG